MAEDMRLKGVAVEDLVLPGQKFNCNIRISNEANSNNLPNSEENCTDRYCRQWITNEDNTSEQTNPNNNIAVDGDSTLDGDGEVLCCMSPVSSREDDSYADYDGQSSSSLDVSPEGDEYHCFSQEDITDSDFSDDGNRFGSISQGIINPNYPEFRDLGNDLEDPREPWSDDNGSNINNNNVGNIEISESVNHLDSVENFQKAFYNKPKFDIVSCGESDAKPKNCDIEKVENGKGLGDGGKLFEEESPDSGIAKDIRVECPDNGNNWFVQEDIVTTAVYPVSGIYETAVLTDDDSDSSRSEEVNKEEPRRMEPDDRQLGSEEENADDSSQSKTGGEGKNKGAKETENEKKMEETMKKDEKTQINVSTKNNSKTKPEEQVSCRSPKEKSRPSSGNRRSLPLTKDKGSSSDLGFFDVYNIETAMPKIDIEAIESHLKAAKEEERRLRDKFSPSEDNVEFNPIAQSPESPANIMNNYVDSKWLPWMPKEMQTEMDFVMQNEVGNGDDENIVERFTYISDTRNFYRKTDREEIRRRLAMGTDNDDYYGGEKTLRKPSLQTRLQSGMNLQICFMNEAMSDNESPNSDLELGNCASNLDNSEEEKNTKRQDTMIINKTNPGSIPTNHVRPSTSLLTLPLKKDVDIRTKALTATDFLSCQAQLQAEARLALSQAKEMARMQMDIERQKFKTSPITEMVRNSLEKVGVPLPHDRRRLSRQILTEMNIAQLQVIVNDLHTQIEKLNENLVKFLIGRDDLHMEQDSMLVDIEDLTRYLGAKEKPQDVPNMNMVNRNNNINRTQNQNRISIGELRSKN